MMTATSRGESCAPIEAGWAKSVCIGEGQVFHDLKPISLTEYERIMAKQGNRELVGMPTVFCQDLPWSVILWPAPDRVYDLVCEPANTEGNPRSAILSRAIKAGK